MTRIEIINKALEISWLGRAQKCPARLVDMLSDIGVSARRGKPVCLSPEEAFRFRNRIVACFELADIALTDPAFRLDAGSDRIGLAGKIANEKIGGRRVTDMRQSSGAGDVFVRLPNAQGYLRMQPEHLLALKPIGIVLVENWQPFEWFHKLSFELPAGISNYHVLYRGDQEAPQDVCENCLKILGCPVIVFPDYDPAGLVNALKVPGMKAILWPGADDLRRSILYGAASAEKYRVQLPGAHDKLEQTNHPDVREIWGILKEYGRVPSQEAFCSN